MKSSLRIILLVIFFLGLAVRAQAQSTTVSGQVTDSPDGQSWNSGTFVFTFVPNANFPIFSNYTWTGGTLPFTVSGSLNVTGGYSVSVPSNTAITPINSQWSLKVCPQGSGSCTTIANVTVTGATQTLNATPSSIRINLSTATPPISAYADAELTGAVLGSQYYNLTSAVNRVCTVVSGNSCTTWAASGGVASVPVLAPTCTPGVTANVNLTINGRSLGEFYCAGLTAACQWQPLTAVSGTVSPLGCGALWDGKGISDASMTINSNTVTCPNSECGFASANLGQIVFGTTFLNNQNSSCVGAACGSVIVPQGFICLINNANSINVGLTFPGCAADNATASCTQAASTLCGLVWMTQDDSTAIQNAATAAWTGTSCKQVGFPSGIAGFTVPSGGLLNVAVPAGGPCGTKILDATQVGPTVAGQGAGSTVLVPLPSTSFANCTGGQSATACVAGPASWQAHDWGINGWGQANNGTTHANNLIEFYGFSATLTGTAAFNMAFSNWDQSTGSTASQGFVIGNSTSAGVLYANNIVSEGFGNTSCAGSTGGTSSTLTLNGLDCFGSSSGTNGASLAIGTNFGTVNSTGSQYWGTNNTSAASAILTKGGGTFNSFSDTIVGSGSVGNVYTVRMTGGGTVNVNFSGSRVTMNAGAGSASPTMSCISTTCNVSAYSASLVANGASAQLFNSQAATFNFFDACANSYTQGGIASTAINIFGSCSITGTPITAAKLVLSGGWGASAAWTALTGATQSVQGTVTNTGAGQAANPTITYTFPTPFLQAPTFCSAYQVGGTQTILAATEFLTPSSLTNTGVIFTYNGTPTVNLTEVYQISCSNQ